MMLEVAMCAMMLAGSQAADAAAAIAELEQRLARAWVQRDRAFIDHLLAADWSVTDASGAVLTKQQVLDQTFATTDRRIDTMTIDDVVVRIFGDTAIATGRTRAGGTYRGQSGTATLRFTDVFVWRGGRWVIVASHASNVVPP
jgi:ketosteroid isomerase-like protein